MNSPRPLRVLHVTYDMRIGGTEQVILNLIRGTDKTVLDHGIFCIEEPLGPWGRNLKEDGVTIRSVNRRAGVDLRVIKALRKALRSQEIDIVHCHQYTPWVYGALAALATPAKVIFTEHGRFHPDTASPKRRFINPLLERITQQVTAISRSTKQALAQYEYLNEDKIAVIYNGIHGLTANESAVVELKQTLGIPPDAPVLGSVARLDPIKNHDMMLRAFRRVLDQQPDSWLLLVGDGETRATMEQLCVDLQISDRVLMPGYVEQPAVWLDAMDIYLLSSFSEGTSMTLLEALSLSTPCVVTDVGGNPEVIQNKKTGFVVPSNDDESFATACLTLIAAPEQRKKMGLAAREDFEHRFHSAIMQRSYNRFYEDACLG